MELEGEQEGEQEDHILMLINSLASLLYMRLLRDLVKQKLNHG